MGRPRTVTDESILQAAYAVLGRVGPAGFTLAAVARQCGLAPATLVQRYGSKRGLQLALAKAAAADPGACFRQVRAEHRSPLAALFASFDLFAGMAATPESLAHSLGFLQQDLADPEFRYWTKLQSQGTLAGCRSLLEEAIAAGELSPDCDVKAMARLLQATAHGSLVTWAFHEDGDAKTWLRRDMRALLKPYRKAGK